MPGHVDEQQAKQWLYWVSRARKILTREWGLRDEGYFARKLSAMEEALMWVYLHMPDEAPLQDLMRAADCIATILGNDLETFPRTFCASNLPLRDATPQWLPLTENTKNNFKVLSEALDLFRMSKDDSHFAGTSWSNLSRGWLPRVCDRVVSSGLTPTVYTQTLVDWHLP